jgi:hypothetical protein
MHRETNTIFEQYKTVVEQQQMLKIGDETINIQNLISAIDKSNLDLSIRNQLKSVLLSKAASPGGPMTPPSAMTGGNPQQGPGPISPPQNFSMGGQGAMALYGGR